MCLTHYNESRRVPGANFTSRRNADGTWATCGWGDGCEKPVRAAGLCNAHYQAYRSGGYAKKKPCPIPGCDRTDLYDRTEGCKKHKKFMWRYSLTIEQAVALYENSRCGNERCAATENLHLDHDHSCCAKGRFETSHKVSCGACVRGWLCAGCNWALGNVQESPEKLEGLAAYVRRAPRAFD